MRKRDLHIIFRELFFDGLNFFQQTKGERARERERERESIQGGVECGEREKEDEKETVGRVGETTTQS